MDASFFVGVVGLTVVVVLVVGYGLSRGKAKFNVVPGAWPVIGNMIEMERLPDIVDEYAEKYGVCEFRFLGKKWVILADEDEVKALSRHRPRRVQRFKPLRRALDDLAPGVFAAEVPQWSIERRLMTPAFNHSNLLSFLPGLDMCAQGLVRAVREEGGNDFIQIAARYTADVIGLVSFGQALKSLEKPDSDLALVFKKLLLAATKRTLALVPLWRVPILGKIIDHFSGVATLKKRTQIAMHQILVQANPESGHSILDKMVLLNRQETETTKKLNDLRLAGNLTTLYIAGSETTATTITWMLYFLARFPDFQASARQELLSSKAAVYSTSNKHHASSFKDALATFPHLRSLFWECLRFYGPASFLFLENAYESIQVANQTLEPQEYVTIIPLRWLAMQPKLGGNTFDPARWLRGSEFIETIPDALTFPFGFGVRICPGKDLAELEACTACAALLRAYTKIELANPDEPAPKPAFQFAMVPDRPIHLRFSS